MQEKFKFEIINKYSIEETSNILGVYYMEKEGNAFLTPLSSKDFKELSGPKIISPGLPKKFNRTPEKFNNWFVSSSSMLYITSGGYEQLKSSSATQPVSEAILAMVDECVIKVNPANSSVLTYIDDQEDFNLSSTAHKFNVLPCGVDYDELSEHIRHFKEDDFFLLLDKGQREMIEGKGLPQLIKRIESRIDSKWKIQK